MTVENMPAAEVDIDDPLVRRLLADQHPELGSLALQRLANGWDNVMYRLGDELVVRLPRRLAGAVLLDNEQRWLGELAPRLPIPIPVPLHIGRPAHGFPWSWSVTRWFDGEVAAIAQIGDPAEQARRLGSFVAALHTAAPADAPVNPVRGGPLADRNDVLRQRVGRVGSMIEASAVLSLWEELVATPLWPGPPVWLHGDLHTANVLVHEGKIAAIIDFGDITSGDPATDLAIGWMLFDPPARSEFRAGCGTVDDDTWARARGWAVHLSLAYLANSADNPLMTAIGLRTLTAALSGP